VGNKPILVFVMTQGVGISEWTKSGVVSRETSLFYEYKSNGWNVVVVTTSKADKILKKDIENTYPEFQFCFLPRNPFLNSILIRSQLMKSIGTIESNPKNFDDKIFVRSNQLLGSHLCYLATVFSKRKFILRQGFNAVADMKNENRIGNLRMKLFSKYEKFLARRADIIEFTSLRSKMQTLENSGSKAQCNVISNFVDIKTWPIQKHREMRIAKEKTKTVIGYFGRFEPQKNLIEFLRACADIPDLEIRLIGDGALREELVKIAESENIEIDIRGSLRQVELQKECLLWDLVIFPSLYEGNPKSILEAMTLGVPVLSTDVPGVDEVIIDEENGFLALGTDSRSIKELINKVMSFGDTTRITTAAQDMIKEKYTLPSIVKSQISSYLELIERSEKCP
jgi:glycosyltransferase involved in cell wall biosynthesis